MTRLELLKIVIGQARANGFEFRRWYTSRLGVPWINAEAALALLESQRRYYALFFSHEFASHFWTAGAEMTFQVPAQSFQRRMADGTIATVARKPFTRRSARPDAWRYHLREMALAENPLRYIRKYLNVQDELEDEFEDKFTEAFDAPLLASAGRPPAKKPVKAAKSGKKKTSVRPLPKDLPAFLRRPYP
jgi:hypothetical protein